MVHKYLRYTKDKVKDSFQAFLVEGARFTNKEGYPILEEWMISKEIPTKIVTFKESLKIKNKEKCKEFFVCFYSPDEDFQRVRRNPGRYINYFKKFRGIIGFDYSVHYDQPPVKQKSQMNDNLALMFYYGKNGVKIIPNIRWGLDEFANEYLDAIPDNNLVAIGSHGFVHFRFQKYSYYVRINKIIEEKHPSGIIIYGTLNGKLFDELKEKVPIYTYNTWIERKTEGRSK